MLYSFPLRITTILCYLFGPDLTIWGLLFSCLPLEDQYTPTALDLQWPYPFSVLSASHLLIMLRFISLVQILNSQQTQSHWTFPVGCPMGTLNSQIWNVSPLSYPQTAPCSRVSISIGGSTKFIQQMRNARIISEPLIFAALHIYFLTPFYWLNFLKFILISSTWRCLNIYGIFKYSSYLLINWKKSHIPNQNKYKITFSRWCYVISF